jgi:hypothetical protein
MRGCGNRSTSSDLCLTIRRTTPIVQLMSNTEIAAFARTEARRAISVGKVDKEGAARIVEAARAKCRAAYAALGMGW